MTSKNIMVVTYREKYDKIHSSTNLSVNPFNDLVVRYALSVSAVARDAESLDLEGIEMNALNATIPILNHLL